MREPEDYGLGPQRTLAQVAPSTPPPGFFQHWSRWRQRVWSGQPRLTPCSESDLAAAGAPGVTHTFESVRHVRIGARLNEALSGQPRGVVITSHGYTVDRGSPLSERNAWGNRSLASLEIRVRGYPGSQFDTGDLTQRHEGYAAIGLEETDGSILFDAVADLVNAVRAARCHFGPAIPLMLHGESFGGALAILAASVLPVSLAPHRLVVGVPTFGWWAWRLSRSCCQGAGQDIARALLFHRDRRAEMMETLSLVDCVVHAHRITSPTLFKVAHRDDVVPAPTAAAVYNALGCDPGRKWRYVTRYAHFDGGLADLRRHAMFERLASEFLDPAEDLDNLMREWEPALGDCEALPRESGRPSVASTALRE